MTKTVQPVILAGGAGTRLWPLSRPEQPKQLLELVGSGTMLEQTLERVRGQSGFERPMIVGAAAQAAEVARIAPGETLIGEPLPRGSAAAIALAALAAGEDVLLLVMPSDHFVGNPQSLRDAVRTGVPAALGGALVTFGIRPTGPETGYGYIIAGGEGSEGALKVESFIEKPPRERAEELLETGGAFWNSGMFLFGAGAILGELERHAPAIAEAARAAMAGAESEGNRILPAAAPLEACPSTSIDYAVMERSDRVAVVPVDLDWSDIGSWAAVYDLGDKDPDGNALDGRSHAIDSRGCLIRSDGPEIVAVGVTDLVIVATKDRVLVVPRSEAQRVREAAKLFDADKS